MWMTSRTWRSVSMGLRLDGHFRFARGAGRTTSTGHGA